MAARVTLATQKDRGRAEHRVETDDKRTYFIWTLPYPVDDQTVGYRVYIGANDLVLTDQEGAVQEALAMIERIRAR